MIKTMRSTNIFFNARLMSTVRFGLVIFALISFLTSGWGFTLKSHASTASSPQRAPSPSTIRIMPANGSAFLVDQRFDIRAEAPPGVTSPLRVALDGRDITEWNNRSYLTKAAVPPPSPTITKASAFLSREWSFSRPGRHTLRGSVEGSAPHEVSFEILPWQGMGAKVRNVILLIGDGMGVAQRTAARIVSRGVTEGRYQNGMLEMDKMQATGLVTTSSLSAMVTDSSPGASCYSTGNKADNNEEGVFPDNTDNDALKTSDPESDAFFDNPRVENISEFLRRKRYLHLTPSFIGSRWRGMLQTLRNSTFPFGHCPAKGIAEESQINQRTGG